MARKKQDSLKAIATQVVKPKESQATPAKKRVGRQDVKTPVRKDVTLRAEELTHGGRLTKAAFAQLKKDFPTQDLKKNFITKQLKMYREQKAEGRPVSMIDWSRKRKHCGRGAIKFTPAVAKKLIDINNRNWGALSFKRLAGKLADEGINVSHVTVRTWCRELGMRRRRRYIKPKLTLLHKINRLSFVLSQIGTRSAQFTDLNNVVHGDEKWFFMMKDGQVCRVFPNKDGHYQLPAPPRVFHKSRMPKVMVLAVCARPRPVYGFDGKVGLWRFTLERPAKRNNIRTGTVVGETIILEDVRVDAVEYRTKVVAKGGVFEKMREVMWWFHTAARYKTVAGVRVPCGKIVSGKWRFSNNEGTKCPEAGTRLLYQHDGARPHTARVNTQVFASHGKMKGFSIEDVVQPSQSPDLNVDDLAFFNSLQSDVSLVAKENRRDLLDAIIKCWHEYPLEKMESVWRCLYSSFHGVLESFGDNDYKRHRGVRDSRDTEDRLQQRTVGRRVIKGAEKKLAEMRSELEAGDVASEMSSDCA